MYRVRMRDLAGLVCAGVCAAGCMWSPATGTQQESTQSLGLTGLAFGANETVSIRARHWDNDSRPQLISVQSSNTAEYEDSNYFAWSTNLSAAVLAPSRYWKPTFLGPLAGSGLGGAFLGMGRLELSGIQRDTPLHTFTKAQQDCVNAALAAGQSVEDAGDDCSDYTTLVRFDVTGYATTISGNLSVFAERNFIPAATVDGSSPVRVQLVSFASPGAGSTVYGLVCSPPDIYEHPLMFYNHGGALGTTTAEAMMCVNAARRGWTFAMTSYRGEPLRIPEDWQMRYGIDPPVTQPLVPLSLLSSGRVEMSLGEVMDVHWMLKLLQDTHPSVGSRTFMWGGSHGGGITLRALQSGANVNAAVALAPAGNWANIVRECKARHDACPQCPPGSGVPCASCLPPTDACYNVVRGVAVADASHAPVYQIVGGQPPLPGSGVNNILRSYDWRSPNFFAQDLAYRRDVTLLVQHGVADNIVNVNQSCKLAVDSFEGFLPTNAWHRTTGGSLTTADVTGCAGITFTSAGAPTNDWVPGQPHLIVYDGVNHGGGPWMSIDFLNFQFWLESLWGV